MVKLFFNQIFNEVVFVLFFNKYNACTKFSIISARYTATGQHFNIHDAVWTGLCALSMLE